MDQAARSPDFNLIEDLWYRVSCLISKNKSKARKELIKQIIAAWFKRLLLGKLTKVVDSLPLPWKMAIKNHGWPRIY